MEKNFLWIIIALLTCGLTVTSFTSCGDDDTTNSGDTTEAPVVEPTLYGDWFSATETRSEDEYEIRYSLISFTEDGVMTMRSYKIFPQEIDNYSERMRRHLSYSVDEVDGILSLNYESGVETNFYELTADSLLVTNGKGAQVFALHRPTTADLELLNDIDRTIWSDDYVGKWFSAHDNNGLYTYMLLEFTEDGKINTKLYSVHGEECTCTTTSRHCGDFQTEKYSGKVLEIHNEKDYKNTTLRWWTIKDNQLYLGEIPQDENNYSVYHPLTPADIEKMAELDRMLEE